MLSRSRERLLRRILTRRGREAEGAVLLEGPRVLATALQLGARMSFAVKDEAITHEAFPELFAILERADVEILEAPHRLFAELAGTETPQGILGVAREPHADFPPSPGAGEERCLVLDGVGDPGNVGTLVRTAAGLSASRVLVLEGTADPWGAKAVRASAGFAFALPVHRLSWDDARTWIDEAGLPLLVADGRGEDVRRWVRAESAMNQKGRGWALLLGNEAHGPRGEALKAASARLRIPISPNVESLNVSVAGSVLLWALGVGRDPSEVS